MIFLYYYSGKQENMPPAKTGGFIFAHSLRRVRVFSPKCPVRLLSCFFSGSFKNILSYFILPKIREIIKMVNLF